MKTLVLHFLDVMDSLKTVESDSELFSKPERIIITGCSGSGKTHLIVHLVKKYHNNFYKIVVNGPKNNLFTFPETKGKTIHYENELQKLYNPLDEVDEIDLENNHGKQLLCIYDDLIEYVHSSDIIANIFTRGRHKNISVILLMQSFFPSSAGRTRYPMIKNNSSVQIFCKMRNVGELNLIAKRLEYDKASQQFLLNLFKDEIQGKRYGYVFVFQDVSNELLRYRNNFLCEDKSPYQTVFTK